MLKKCLLIFLSIIVIFSLLACNNVISPPSPSPSSSTSYLDHDPILLVHGINLLFTKSESGWDTLTKELTTIQTDHKWTDGGILNKDTNDIEVKSADFYRIRFSSGNNLTFEEQGKELKHVVELIHNKTGGKNVILVCHSMGGLAARSYLQDSNNNRYVSALITIGTPNTGSYLAYLPDKLLSSWLSITLNSLFNPGAAIGPEITNLAVEWIKNNRKAIEYLKPDSKEMITLNSNLHNLPLNIPYICITSELTTTQQAQDLVNIGLDLLDPYKKKDINEFVNALIPYFTQYLAACNKNYSFFSNPALALGDGVVPLVGQYLKTAALNNSNENLKWTQEAKITSIDDLNVFHCLEPNQTSTIMKALQTIFFTDNDKPGASNSGWTRQPPPLQGELLCIWGSSSSDVFADGLAGTMLHYDGHSWAKMNSGTTDVLRGIWGSSNSDVFVAGYQSIHHYDGHSWAKMSSGTPYIITSVWGSSSSDVFAGDEKGTILHYDGHSWTKMNSGTGEFISSIWGSSSSDVFAVCNQGIILHYDGHSWAKMNSSTPDLINSVWGSSSSDVFAVGFAGTILHYDGRSWTQMNIGTTSTLHSIWGSSSKDVFAVGEQGTILHYVPPK
jgi:hypothetical protein